MMVCDGHVFNGDELRAHLRDRGHTVVHAHSCELLLHLYEDEGVSGWRRADGQFALALWDARAKRLVLGPRLPRGAPALLLERRRRHRVRVRDQGAARNRRVPRAVDEAALADFLTFTSVPGPRTLFRDVRKVPPGSAVICCADGTVRRRDGTGICSRIRFRNRATSVSTSSACARCIARSVAGRDVEGPIGSLLSGGNDSSANAALLARHRSRTAPHVHGRPRRPRRRRQVQRPRVCAAGSRPRSDRCITSAC